MNPSSKIERVEKPWGYELIWAKTAKYAGKVLHLNKDRRLSYQYHRLKDEALFVASGRILVELEEEGGGKTTSCLNAGECLHIPALTRHRIMAVEDSDLFEVSTPELDDVVRLQDDYGRTQEK